jgi:glucose/arabinose dehydrogenase
MRRRELLRSSAVAAAAVGLSGCFTQQDDQAIEQERVGLETVATGLTQPTNLAHAPGDDDLWLVTEQAGTVRAVTSDGLVGEPVVDVGDELVDRSSWEQGLVGIAFHPDFTDNRTLYLRFSATPRDGTPADYSHTFVLEELRLTEDRRSVVTDSRQTILEIPQPGPVHNSGAMAFGPEGLLYVGVGDGGGDQFDTGPGHASDWYDHNKGGNGQDVTENLCGSVLRLDVDSAENGQAYSVPESNPLVDSEGLDEHYAWGLRNPWGFSFHDGQLFTADVGQDNYEEINIIEKGGNYGWNVREGPECFFNVPSPSKENRQTPESCPEETPRGKSLRTPIVSYAHQQTEQRTTSAVGGYVYGGSEIPWLEGSYVFGDFFRNGSAHIFSASPPDNGDGAWSMTELDVAGREGNRLSEALTAFGEAENGELYISTINFQNDGSGSIYRLTPTT